MGIQAASMLSQHEPAGKATARAPIIPRTPDLQLHFGDLRSLLRLLPPDTDSVGRSLQSISSWPSNISRSLSNLGLDKKRWYHHKTYQRKQHKKDIAELFNEAFLMTEDVKAQILKWDCADHDYALLQPTLSFCSRSKDAANSDLLTSLKNRENRLPSVPLTGHKHCQNMEVRHKKINDILSRVESQARKEDQSSTAQIKRDIHDIRSQFNSIHDEWVTKSAKSDLAAARVESLLKLISMGPLRDTVCRTLIQNEAEIHRQTERIYEKWLQSDCNHTPSFTDLE